MKSGRPKKAPKVPNPRPNSNYMKEADTKLRLKSKMWPMKVKRLSKQLLFYSCLFNKKAPFQGLFSFLDDKKLTTVLLIEVGELMSFLF